MDKNFRLSDLSPVGKLFVGIFTTLMLLVCLWAMFVFYVEKGMVDQSPVQDYSSVSQSADNDSDGAEPVQSDVEEILEDSSAVLAPIWDTNVAGEEVAVDSATLQEQFEDQADQGAEAEPSGQPWQEDEFYHFRENVGVAHAHINSQTMLFFAMGLVFLFTSVKVGTKKLIYWIFGAAVSLHAVGLTGEGFYGSFDNLVAASGAVILACILYMALMIYADLGKKGKNDN